jgi:signal transduction histidine kinase
LTNVRKHAAVKVAAVRAQPVRAGNGIVVTVEDQGQGFVTGTRRGFGTTESIIRRLNDAGGAATIESTPGEGTLVTLEWPR